MPPDITFEPARHKVTPSDERSKAILNGDFNVSVWETDSVDSLRHFQPDVLAIDSVLGTDVTEAGKLEDRTAMGYAYSWQILPLRPSKIRPDGTVLVLGGDYRDASTGFSLDLAKLEAAYVAAGGLALGSSWSAAQAHRHRPEKLMSRRNFLHLAGGIAVGAAAAFGAYEGLGYSRAHETLFSNFAQWADRHDPLYISTLGASAEEMAIADGRTALIAEKVINFASAHTLDRAMILLGSAHARGDKVITNHTQRLQAILGLADLALEAKAIKHPKEAWVQLAAEIRNTLPKVSLITYREINDRRARANPLGALHAAITPRASFTDPGVAEVMASWRPALPTAGISGTDAYPVRPHVF